jgi:hypothetical protein
MGIWAQAENDKGFTFTEKADDFITEGTGNYCKASITRNMGAATTFTVSKGIPLAPNDVSMGYEDKNIVYSNIDTSLSGADYTPASTTGSTNAMSSGAYQTTNLGPVAPVPIGKQTEVFVYSIINSAKPAGFSDAVFW